MIESVLDSHLLIYYSHRLPLLILNLFERQFFDAHSMKLCPPQTVDSFSNPRFEHVNSVNQY